MKFRKKVIIEATQWFKRGDHPQDNQPDDDGHRHVVQNYPAPPTGHTTCAYCGVPTFLHGWIKTLEGGHIVCPGDWVITGIEGEHYPCKPGIFDATYERVDEE